MSISTITQSYQDDGRVIMKDRAQWNFFSGEWISAFSVDPTRDL